MSSSPYFEPKLVKLSFLGGPPKCIERRKRKKKTKKKGKKRDKSKGVSPSKDENSTMRSTLENEVYDPQPYIYCPPDLVKDLPADSPTVYVRIPQPKTNVDWYDRVKAAPAWAKNLEAELGLGRTQVTFQARAASGQVASCSFTIHVRDTIPPRVYNCPTDFNVYLEPGVKEKKVEGGVQPSSGEGTHFSTISCPFRYHGRSPFLQIT